MKPITLVFHYVKRVIKKLLPKPFYDRLYNKFWGIFLSKKNKFSLFKKQNIISYPLKLPKGVNLFIYDLKNSSDTENRLLKKALEKACIPYHVFDLVNPDRMQIKNKLLYNVNLVVGHAASGTINPLLSMGINLKKHYNIGYWAWELAELPDEFCFRLNSFQELWTISTFCTNSIEKKSSIPVLTVPLYADNNKSVIKNGRDYFNIDDKIFLFMFAYDCMSYVSRKNPQALVKAFIKAFAPEDTRIGLVLKLNYSQHYKEDIKQLQELLSSYPHIYYIDKYLSNDEMRTLLHISDAFVSLHRSEGFGNLPLEAMALGTPVISTAWSGNMEYMNHMNTALVGYNLIPVNGEYPGSKPGDGYVWADPDIDEAAAHMRRIVTDNVWREDLIKNGKHTADNCYNTTNIGKIIRQRLEFLKLI